MSEWECLDGNKRSSRPAVLTINQACRDHGFQVAEFATPTVRQRKVAACSMQTVDSQGQHHSEVVLSVSTMEAIRHTMHWQCYYTAVITTSVSGPETV